MRTTGITVLILIILDFVSIIKNRGTSNTQLRNQLTAKKAFVNTLKVF